MVFKKLTRPSSFIIRIISFRPSLQESVLYFAI